MVGGPGTEAEIRARELIASELLRRADERGGFLTWSELSSFRLPDGLDIRLVDPGRGGIWNPRDRSATLTVVTLPDGPYADTEVEGGLLLYHYQSGPEGGKNLKLRAAMELGLPIVRLQKIAANAYLPIYPVYVVGDDPDARVFTLTLDPAFTTLTPQAASAELIRQHVERVVRQRVHQPAFRARVMLAYDTRCTICLLRHASLLDAAHIVADRETGGVASVTNGLSLCKIHHAAYDANLLGISPDFRVHVNAELLEEVDGPMLRHGLQEMDRRSLYLPRAATDQPDRARLELRFGEFLAS